MDSKGILLLENNPPDAIDNQIILGIPSGTGQEINLQSLVPYRN
jgi:hypothetical protein